MKASPMSLISQLLRYLRLAGYSVLTALLTACSYKPITENVPPPQYVDLQSEVAETAFDWAGTYKDLLPCRGCEGVVLHVVLRRDKTAIVHESRKDEALITPSTVTYNGPFSFGGGGLSPNLIQLASSPNAAPIYQFLVGENWLELRHRANGTPLSYDLTHRLPKIKAAP